MLIMLLSLALAQSPPVVDPCTHDRAALLALAPAAFDQDLEGGWKPLGAKPECAAVAADLLAAYRKAH